MRIDLDRDRVSGLCSAVLQEARAKGPDLKRTHVLNALARAFGYPHGAALQNALKHETEPPTQEGDGLEECRRLAAEQMQVHGATAARAMRIAMDQDKAPVLDIYRCFLAGLDDGFLITYDCLWKKLGEFDGGFEVGRVYNVDPPAASATGDPNRPTWVAEREVHLEDRREPITLSIRDLVFEDAWKLVESMPHPDEALQIPSVRDALREIDRERARLLSATLEMHRARQDRSEDDLARARARRDAARRRLRLD